MTISCPIYGQIWGRPAFSRALRRLSDLGVEWVALHPYARISRDGRVSSTPPAETDHLPAAVDRARAAGMKLFWKPHLAYWGSFEWRGAIDFGDDPAAWERFFRTYRAFILDHARFAARARVPLFAVGTELERTLRFEGRWRALIAEIRSTYPGTLTWAANWDGVERVPFWDALDLVGVQAYFPLGLEPGADRAEIERALARPLGRLRALSRRVDRPVLFTEIGYPDAPHAGRTPWKPRRARDARASAFRGRLVEVAARQLAESNVLVGMFWWKWIPGARHARRDFAMQAEEARAALRRAWASRAARKGYTADAASPGPR